MNMRRFSSETQRNYLRDIGRLATFLGRSPDTATADDLRRSQIEQQEDGVPVPTMNSIGRAVRTGSFPACSLFQYPLGGTGTFILRQFFAMATPEMPISFEIRWIGIDHTSS